MARIGGNPDFGTKYKFDFGNEEVRSQALTIRVTPSFLEEVKNIAGDRYRDFCRDAIAAAVKRHVGEASLREAATETKTETTGLATADQPQQHNQTTQLNLELETDPTPEEQVATPKKQRKERQTPARKQAKPTTQTRRRKNTATETTTEQGQ
ncbi:hypothetical protein LC612_33510 [Nostoc sp. CHAB 5834]|nr:hypothetical protein [Nostoc sp. CHAB 5834]